MDTIFVEIQNAIIKDAKDVDRSESVENIITHLHLFDSFTEFVTHFSTNRNKKVAESISSILSSIVKLLQDRKLRFSSKVQENFFLEETGDFSISTSSLLQSIEKYPSIPHFKELTDSIGKLPSPKLNFLELVDILIQFEGNSYEWIATILLSMEEYSSAKIWRLLILVIIKVSICFVFLTFDRVLKERKNLTEIPTCLLQVTSVTLT